ncbi:MAG: hypothetical protein ACU833_03260 [Gammaproteobacteria bacterium]
MEKIVKSIMRCIQVIVVFSVSYNVWSANANSPHDGFATLTGGGGTVIWELDPGLQFDSVVLNLSPYDGGVLREEFDTDPEVSGLEDGQYKYELLLIPKVGNGLKEELKAIREAAGGQEGAPSAIAELRSQGILPQRRQVQSGSFTLEGGALVGPSAE